MFEATGMTPSGALLVHTALSIAAVAGILIFAAFLRERRSGDWLDTPYESGITPSASSAPPYNARYFLIAAFFVIFDMEAAILFAWAVAAREAGWLGVIEAAIFIGVLLAALVYLWLDGALEFGVDATREVER